LQQWDHLGVEEGGQRVGAAAIAGSRFVGWWAVIVFEAIGGGGADRCLGRGDNRRVGLT